MFKVVFVVFISLGCSRLLAQTSDVSVKATELFGHWKLVETKIVDEVEFLNLPKREISHEIRVAEDSPWDSYQRFDLVFEKDSMFRLQYPIQSFASARFFLDSSYLHYSTNEESGKCPARLLNDTLFLYRSLPYDEGYFKEAFVRTSFNDSVLQVMKTYGINYPELAGTWELVREEDYDYGTHYELKFPYSLPDSINLSRKQMLAALQGDRTILISTNGKPRAYTFWFANSCMYLKPGDWYHGDDPMIHFSRRD